MRRAVHTPSGHVAIVFATIGGGAATIEDAVSRLIACSRLDMKSDSMNGPPERRFDAAQRAALFGAMFKAIRRRSRLSAAVLPFGMAPVSIDRSADILGPQPREDASALNARCRAVALVAGSGGSQDDIRSFLSDSEYADYADKADDAPCKFCLARDCCLQSSGRGLAFVVTKHGKWSTDFEPAQRITTVAVRDYEFETSTSNVPTLVRRVNPQNWDQSPGGFFVTSQPGTWSNGHWNPGAWKDGGGDLLEQTQWQWNEDASGQISNILRISNLVQSAGAISYDYSLRECIKSNFGLSWRHGGMDVDNGNFSIRSSRASAGRSRVHVEGRKAVRYTSARSEIPEFATFLNLLASTLISLLMHELVYHLTEGLQPNRD
jgi:hypothetical protein